MPDDLLRMLEEMDRSATKAPWSEDDSGEAGPGLINGPDCIVGDVAIYADETTLTPETPANARLIVALRNSLPALLDVLRAADAVMDECGQVGSPALGTAERYHAARARFAQAIKEGKS